MANEKILMIDDDSDHLRLCRLILERNGYRVRTLSKTKEALDATIAFKPDMVFMDHFMPGTSGIEITGILKSNADTKHIPVVYLSSIDDIDVKAKEAGADFFIKKPFQFVDFLGTIKKFYF